MKNRWIVFVVILAALVSLSVFAADKALSSRARVLLEKAYVNEMQAVARYEAFARKADDEGYVGAAGLFRATARAEGIHARRFEAALTQNGVTLPAVPEVEIRIGTTAENLRSSASAESDERDGIYKEAIVAAGSDQVLAKTFDQTRDTEVEHANLFANALRNLNAMKEHKDYFVCDRCGYTTDIDLSLCALCRNNEHPHHVD
jgi:rubrerythrin